MPNADGAKTFDAQLESGLLARKMRAIAEEIPAEQRLSPRGVAHQVLGLRKPELLAVVSDWLKENADVSDANLLQLCERLWGGPTREEQMVATRLLARRRSALRNPPWAEIDRWREAVASIEGADAFAVHVLGPWVLHDVSARTEPIRTMIDNGNMIDRRIALIATVPLIHDKASAGYPGIVLQLVDRADGDAEPMVVDAVTWVLCALARRHRGVVEEFIVDSAALHPLVRGQVDNWLRTGSRKNAAVHEWRIPQSTKLFPAGGSSSSGIPSETPRC